MNNKKKGSQKNKQDNKPKLLNEDALDELINTNQNINNNNNNENNTSTNTITNNNKTPNPPEAPKQQNNDDFLKKLQGFMAGDNNINNPNEEGKIGDILSQLENIIKSEIPKEEYEKELAKMEKDTENLKENQEIKEIKENSEELEPKKEEVKTYSIKELKGKIEEDIKKEPDNPKHYHAMGELMKFVGNEIPARESFEKCISLEPENPEFYFSLGEVYEIFQKNLEALENYKKSIELYEKNPNKYNSSNYNEENNQENNSNLNIEGKFILKYCSVLNKLEKYQESLNQLNDFLQKNPNDHIAWELKGITLKKSEKFKEALEAYDKSIQIEANNFNCFYNKGILHQKFNEMEKAKDCYIKANQCKNISNNYAYVNLAAIYKNENNLPETVNCYEKALLIDQFDFEIYLPLANLLEKMNKNEEAINLLKKMEKLSKKNSIKNLNFLNLMGDLLKKTNKKSEADKYYSLALENDSSHKESILAKTNSLNSMGKFEEALNILNDQLKNNNEEDIDYLLNKAISLQGLQKWEESNKVFDIVIQKEPEIPDIYSGKALNLMKMNKLVEAIKFFVKGIEMNKKNDIAIWNLGICYVENNQLQKAFETFGEYNKLVENNFSSYNAIGSILINLGKFSEAIKYLDKSIEINKDFAMTYFYKGVSLQNLMEYEDAIECYDTALSIDPKLEMAKKNKKDIWAELRKLTSKKRED